MREVQDKDREEEIKISGFLSLSLSVNKQNISSCELHKEVQDLFRKVKTFQEWKSLLKYFPIPTYALHEERKTLVMFREKAKLMKVLTTTVQHFQALTSPVPSPPSSPSSGSQCRSGVKSLPPTLHGHGHPLLLLQSGH